MSDKPVLDLRNLARVLVDTVELEVNLEDDELLLRFELFESLAQPRHYSARIWRLEYYRIQSTFPQLPGGKPKHDPSDEVILKEFEGYESPLQQPVEFANALAARDYVLDQFASWLLPRVPADVIGSDLAPAI